LVENQHVPVEEAIQKAFGVTSAQFDSAVKNYFHSLTVLNVALDASKQPNAPANPQQVYEFPEIVGPNDSAITNGSLAEADARAVVAEVRIRIPDRREAGLSELRALAGTAEATVSRTSDDKHDAKPSPNKAEDKKSALAAAGNEVAHRVLAWDDLQRGDFDAAGEELSNAAALNPRDMWIRYYLCVLKHRIARAKHNDILGLPNMLQDLRAVLEWYPEFADAYDLMATARKEGGSSVSAMQAERAAMQLSPRNQQYVYNLAEIYIADKKWEAAVVLLQRLKGNSNPQIAAAARDRLEQIPNEQKYGAAAAAASAQKFTPQSSPFDVLEQDAAKRAIAAQASQTAANVDKRAAKFVQGRLVAVDCSQSPAAVLTVNAAGAVLKLRTSDYKSLLLIGADAFSCDWRDRSVSVNYKPGGLSDGDLVSVEVR
jgi:tetratricopeptide (TPR) repeat protein